MEDRTEIGGATFTGGGTAGELFTAISNLTPFPGSAPLITVNGMADLLTVSQQLDILPSLRGTELNVIPTLNIETDFFGRVRGSSFDWNIGYSGEVANINIIVDDNGVTLSGSVERGGVTSELSQSWDADEFSQEELLRYTGQFVPSGSALEEVFNETASAVEKLNGTPPAAVALFAQETLLNTPDLVPYLQQNFADFRVQRCFAAGTMITMADGGSKRIENIQRGDLVASYTDSGSIVSRAVVRTFTNSSKVLLDVHGLKVTPEHVTLCGDGQFANMHVPIIDILLSDGALVKEDGTLVRMAINQPVGSLEDHFVKVCYALTAEDAQSGHLQTGEMRVGTLLFDQEGEPVSVLDCIRAESMSFDRETGLVCRNGQSPEPLYFYGLLPRPESYILGRSRETLDGILADGEWEGSPSELLAQRLHSTTSARLN